MVVDCRYHKRCSVYICATLDLRPVASMNNSSLPTIAPLTHLCAVRITGADAADFLHGQLTQDITGLPPGEARLAGYCTPKGRLLGTLSIWCDPLQNDELVALLSAGIATTLVKPCSMFLLHAKA